MANSTNICPDTRNLTCRPRGNLMLRKELERQCHVQMLILLVVAFTTGCLLVTTVRIVNKYWCNSRRRARQSASRRRMNRSDHYITSIVGGMTPPRVLPQGAMPIQQEEILLYKTDFCGKTGQKYCRTAKRTLW